MTRWRNNLNFNQFDATATRLGITYDSCMPEEEQVAAYNQGLLCW